MLYRCFPLIFSLGVCPAIWAADGPADAIPAREPVYRLDPVVVSASRLESTVSDLTTGATIITRQDIEARRPVDLVDLLRGTPGVHVDQPGGSGISSIYLRGADPNFTAVMIDGVIVNDPTNSRGGSYDLSAIDVANIERIEIIRGAMSFRYGSNAMAGVVHIITRQGTPQLERELSSSLGRHGYQRFSGVARGPLEGLSGKFSVDAAYSDRGLDIANSENLDRHVGARFDFQPTSDTIISLNTRFAEIRRRSFPEDSGGPRLAVLRDTDQRDAHEFTTSLALTRDFTDAVRLALSGSFYERESEFESPGVAPGVRDPFGFPPNSAEDDLERVNVQGHVNFSIADDYHFSTGIDADFEHGSSDTVIQFGPARVPGRFDDHRMVAAPFVEGRAQVTDELLLHGGARVDMPDDFDAEFSPRLGLRYDFPASNTVLRLNWGESFKLPSFYALSHPIVGNQNLNPETGRSVDIGVIQRFDSVGAYVEAAYFYNEYFDLIDFDRTAALLVNRSDVTAKGVEVSAGMEFLETLRVENNLTYTDHNIRDTKEELRSRPEWRYSLSMNWQPVETVTTTIAVVYVDGVFDSSISTGDTTLPDYWRTDVSCVWHVKPDVELALVVDNLFDEDYEEAVGFRRRE